MIIRNAHFMVSTLNQAEALSVLSYASYKTRFCKSTILFFVYNFRTSATQQLLTTQIFKAQTTVGKDVRNPVISSLNRTEGPG